MPELYRLTGYDRDGRAVERFWIDGHETAPTRDVAVDPDWLRTLSAQHWQDSLAARVEDEPDWYRTAVAEWAHDTARHGTVSE